MFKLIAKALAGLVLTEEAQQAVGRAGAKGDAKLKPNPPPPASRKAAAKAKTRPLPVLTPHRQALIRRAQEVRNAQRRILDELDDESRARLVAMAITAFLAEDPTKK